MIRTILSIFLAIKLPFVDLIILISGEGEFAVTSFLKCWNPTRSAPIFLMAQPGDDRFLHFVNKWIPSFHRFESPLIDYMQQIIHWFILQPLRNMAFVNSSWSCAIYPRIDLDIMGTIFITDFSIVVNVWKSLSSKIIQEYNYYVINSMLCRKKFANFLWKKNWNFFCHILMCYSSFRAVFPLIFYHEKLFSFFCQKCAKNN